MDPKATLDLMRIAYVGGDYSGAHEHAVNLLRWIRNGGHVPTLDVSEFIMLLEATTSYLDMCAS